MTQKKKWSPKAKLEIALLALKGDMTNDDYIYHQFFLCFIDLTPMNELYNEQ